MHVSVCVCARMKNDASDAHTNGKKIAIFRPLFDRRILCNEDSVIPVATVIILGGKIMEKVRRLRLYKACCRHHGASPSPT